MKRSYLIDEPVSLKRKELFFQTAFHEAGHAAAIYLNNKEKNLPPVYFHISLSGLCTADASEMHNAASESSWIARVDGGHLIHSLPVSVLESRSYFSRSGISAYQAAYEADVFNLLAGPIAEAKYVAESDGELMNPRLVNVDALKYYGGTADLEMVNEYLEGLIASKEKRAKKLEELFFAAFKFIERPAYWRAISHLAQHIISAEKNIVTCEEVIEVLDLSLNFSKSASALRIHLG